MDEYVPEWSQALEEADWQFLKRFMLSRGSLKLVAQEYGVSYPTIRERLDRLIEKIETGRAEVRDAFYLELQIQLAAGQLTAGVAKKLLQMHQEVLDEVAQAPGHQA